LILEPLIASKSAVTRRRWMSDFLTFDEGNVSYIPESKDEKDDIQLSDE